MLEFFDYFIIGFVLAFIVVPWHLTFGAAAIVLLSAGVGSLVGSFFFGWLADSVGRMPVLYITTGIMTIPSAAMYFAPEGNWIYLTVFRLLVGFGVGGLFSVDLPLVQEFVPTRIRGAVDCDRADSLGNLARKRIRRIFDSTDRLARTVPDRPSTRLTLSGIPVLDARVPALAG